MHSHAAHACTGNRKNTKRLTGQNMKTCGGGRALLASGLGVQCYRRVRSDAGAGLHRSMEWPGPFLNLDVSWCLSRGGAMVSSV